ncbi:MAG: hypothetical protein HQL24_04365 [Candidatus Omnitrophica bacterium]|nr:hypothetical protein [Candidatus Omnitrophota bacterium]
MMIQINASGNNFGSKIMEPISNIPNISQMPQRMIGEVGRDTACRYVHPDHGSLSEKLLALMFVSFFQYTT